MFIMTKFTGKNKAPSAVGTHHEGNFQIYFAHKMAKLDAIQIADPSVLVTNIFENCTIFVNGQTSPPSAEIRRLVVTNGGTFQTYHTASVTHIVCDHFTDAQLKQELINKTRLEKIFFVTAQWVTDTVISGKRLVETKYAPKGWALRFGGDITQLFGMDKLKSTKPLFNFDDCSVDLTSPINGTDKSHCVKRNCDEITNISVDQLNESTMDLLSDDCEALAQRIFQHHFRNDISAEKTFEYDVEQILLQYVEFLLQENNLPSMITKGRLILHLCELLVEHDLIDKVQALLKIVETIRGNLSKNILSNPEDNVALLLFNGIEETIKQMVCDRFGCIFEQSCEK